MMCEILCVYMYACDMICLDSMRTHFRDMRYPSAVGGYESILKILWVPKPPALSRHPRVDDSFLPQTARRTACRRYTVASDRVLQLCLALIVLT